MGAALYYPPHGRGAWPVDGAGGTLHPDGTRPGRFYRAVAAKAVTPPGRVGFYADRDSSACSIDGYAVHRAVLAIQVELRDLGYVGADGRPLHLDGVWGPNTGGALIGFQDGCDLSPDGVYGPATSRVMWRQALTDAAADVEGSGHAADLGRLMAGTITWESGWDLGAVGSDPDDLGLGQINGPAHPTMSVHDRINPKMALPWVARFIDANLRALDFDVPLAAAAYNLGVAGARKWARAGKPDLWTPPGSSSPRNVNAYVEKILTRS